MTSSSCAVPNKATQDLLLRLAFTFAPAFVFLLLPSQQLRRFPRLIPFDPAESNIRRRKKVLHVKYQDVLLSSCQNWRKQKTLNGIVLKLMFSGAEVVAQLAERSLPTPEIRGLNPNIGKNYLPIVF